MIIIGVDPHKSTHTANAVDAAANKTAGSLQIDASLPGYRRLLRWAGQFGERRWAVENARGLGRHLAQWLAARGEHVVDVPSTATARVRELSRGGRRKNDVMDAAAAAAVAMLQGDATPVLAEDASTVLALLDERRNNVITQRTRLVNQLHALLRDLLPGDARADLTAAAAAQLLARVRPAGPAGIAGRLLGRVRRASRFCSAAVVASYCGAAPVEVASAGRARHRLPRGGDRQLNLALHIVALTRVRMRASTGRAYYDTKIAAGKTHNEAMRCLKRRLADHLWRLMIADERHARTGPGGHLGATTTSSAAGSTPITSSSDKSLPGPATTNSMRPPSAA
jgi:transposase